MGFGNMGIRGWAQSNGPSDGSPQPTINVWLWGLALYASAQICVVLGLRLTPKADAPVKTVKTSVPAEGDAGIETDGETDGDADGETDGEAVETGEAGGETGEAGEAGVETGVETGGEAVETGEAGETGEAVETGEAGETVETKTLQLLTQHAAGMRNASTCGVSAESLERRASDAKTLLDKRRVIHHNYGVQVVDYQWGTQPKELMDEVAQSSKTEIALQSRYLEAHSQYCLVALTRDEMLLNAETALLDIALLQDSATSNADVTAAKIKVAEAEAAVQESKSACDYAEYFCRA
jgi:hypothetical protein